MGVKYLCFVIEDIDGSTIFVPVESVSYFQRGGPEGWTEVGLKDGTKIETKKEPAEVMASRTTFEL